ncbi:single-stranded DNA-binding protein [Arthrobacter sp. NyZ413]|uniref:single-stranded DNA-binding protein n=1 Tax=Arthrobacter sp. NyZ413 TaxID=3144669 RepID=UPI003BF784C8
MNNAQPPRRDPGLPPRREGLSPRTMADLETFGREANPSATVNPPVIDPYVVLPDPVAPWYDTETPATNTAHAPQRSTGKAVTMSGETTITVTGNLTADPELRQVTRGSGTTPVVNFTIASTPRTYDAQANEWKDGETLFLRATAWRDLAEHAVATLSKGSRVVATGVLKPRSYETRTGEKRTVVELEIEEIGVSLKFGPIHRTSTHTTAPSGAVRTRPDAQAPAAPAVRGIAGTGNSPAVNADGYAEDDPWFGKDANPAAWATEPAEPSF